MPLPFVSHKRTASSIICLICEVPEHYEFFSSSYSRFLGAPPKTLFADTTPLGTLSLRVLQLMKVLSVAALSAIAAAVPAPRISLDLTSMGVAPLELTTPIVRAHDLGETQPDGAAVMSRQDYTMKCKADFDTAATCPLPTANAFDHIDQKTVAIALQRLQRTCCRFCDRTSEPAALPSGELSRPGPP